MSIEIISSRKNTYIAHVRALASDGAYRREQGQFLCDGIKTLREAVTFGAEIVSVLWREQAAEVEGLAGAKEYAAPAELFDYASPLKNSPGPLFAVRMRRIGAARLKNAIVLEGVQDPGNVGTVIRTANAFGVDAVILTGACADLFNPKTVRATMGAVFRQRVLELPLAELRAALDENGLPLYGAALSETARDFREIPLDNAAVAVGSEGNGLSAELLAMCDGQLIIPMRPDSESLNAGVAASVIMWEMSRGSL